MITWRTSAIHCMHMCCMNLRDTLTAAARLGQLGERRSSEREVASSNHDRANAQGRRKCWLCNNICKQLGFLVFSDKGQTS